MSLSLLLAWQTRAYHAPSNGPEAKYTYSPAVVTPYDYASTIPVFGFPQAPHFFQKIDKGTEDIVYLYGYDGDGTDLQATVTCLPKTGKLYHLSQVYNDYGYEPKKGVEVKVNDKLTSTDNRVLYVRPKNDKAPAGMWDTFKYSVTETCDTPGHCATTRTSNEGVVTLGHQQAVVTSDYSTSADGWSIVNSDCLTFSGFYREQTYKENVGGGANTHTYAVTHADAAMYAAGATSYAIKGAQVATLTGNANVMANSGYVQEPLNGVVKGGANTREAPVYQYTALGGSKSDGRDGYGGHVRGVDGDNVVVHNKGVNEVHNYRSTVGSSATFYRDNRYPGFMMLKDCPHASNTSPVYEPSTRGKGMQYYIHYTDKDVKSTEEGSDQKHWFFAAPAKFLGHQGILYGGKLKFTLSASTGDFSAKNINHHRDLVVLECKTCDQNKGVRLVYQMAKNHVKFDGRTTSFEVPFTEKNWLKDPKNVLLDWAPPADCELIEVLSHLTSLNILGDHTRWFETVSLDDVSMEVASNSAELPSTKCYTKYSCRTGMGDCTTAQSKC